MYEEANMPATALNKDIEVRRPTMTETLRERKAQLERQLAEVTAALVALESNPEVQKVLDLLQKVRHL